MRRLINCNELQPYLFARFIETYLKDSLYMTMSLISSHNDMIKILIEIAYLKGI